MNRRSEYRDVKVMGIDLGKHSFQVHSVDAESRTAVGKKLSRGKLKECLVNLPPCTVAMEACAGAHYWGRLARSYGHEVKLIAPQFVKPYVKSNKSDAADAEAICEAAQRPNMRFVAVKEVGQQDVLSIHRMRSLTVERRTAQINQTRGLLLEYGIEIPAGRVNLLRRLPEVLEDAGNGLTDVFREELFGLYGELRHLDDRIAHDDHKLKQIAQADERMGRLQTIPGIGPLIATALLAAIGDIHAFKNGRELAAWLGLVPRQHSTGGKSTLLGISKRGDVYLRQLVIHGARSILLTGGSADRPHQPLGRYAQGAPAQEHRHGGDGDGDGDGDGEQDDEGRLRAIEAQRDLPRAAGCGLSPCRIEPKPIDRRRFTEGPPTSCEEKDHCDGMKGKSCIPGNLIQPWDPLEGSPSK